MTAAPFNQIKGGVTIRVHGVGSEPVEFIVGEVEDLGNGSIRITPEASA